LLIDTIMFLTKNENIKGGLMFPRTMRNLMVLLLVSISVSLPLTLWAQTPHKSLTTQISDDTVLVKFYPGTAGAAKSQAHDQVHGTVSKRIKALGVEVVRVPKGTVKAALTAYNKNPNVSYAEPNRTRPLFIPVTNEGMEPGLGITNNYTEQYGLHNTGQDFGALAGIFGTVIYPAFTASAGADIDWPEGMAAVTTGTTVAVAILDSGVNCTHLDLAGKCIEEISYVEDNGSPPEDLIGHGTHVAGIIAAITDNGIGIAGVAPDAKIGSYKVCWEDLFGGFCDDDDISSALVDAANATDEANSKKYRVINLSLAGPDISSTLGAAIQYAWNEGLVIVAGAGNNYSTEIMYPAGYSAAIAVGATDYHDNLAAYSTFGNWVSVLAPGTSIFSTIPGTACGQNYDGSDCYGWNSGTSMATPHVAGLAAVLAAESNDYTNVEIRSIIENSADTSGVLGQNFKAWVSNGRINMFEALTYSGGSGGGTDTTYSVQSIVLDTLSVGRGNKKARATVTIIDNFGNTVSGATVTGDFAGDYTDTNVLSSVTNGTGTAVLTTTSVQKGGVTFEFCVTNVVGDPSATAYNGSDCETFP
jgi:thermitase